MRKLVLAAFAALLVCASAYAQQSSPFSYLSAKSNNSTLVRTGPGLLTALVLVNTTATLYYFKLYDKATAPTCGTDTPTQRIAVSASATGVATVVDFSTPLVFRLGVGFCLVGGIADNDNTDAATGLTLNLGVR